MRICTGIYGEMIRDLMTDAATQSFGKVEILPKTVQFLSVNGSIYRTGKIVEFAKALGFEPYTTPIYSPLSNGMAKSFAKTFKPDYVRINDLWSADQVLNWLHDWFDNHNENHPNKGLKMLSPRKYRK